MILLKRLHNVTRSLFGRLFLISLITAILILIVVFSTLRDIQIHNPSNQISHNLLTLTFAETPPTPEGLRRIETDTGWDLIVTGPGFLWPGPEKTNLLPRLEEEAGDTDYGFFWLDKQRWLVFRQGDFNYFITTFKLAFSAGFKRILLRGLIALLVVSFLSYCTIRWLFMPIKDLKSGADRIAGGDLNHRMATKRSDEIGAVTHSVNDMADRLRQALEEKRQLLLAVGHELRTPLTRIKLLLEMLPESRDREQVIRNLDEINHLVVTLLDAEALSGGFVALERTRTDIKGFLQKCCAVLDQPVAIQVADEPPPITLDQTRMQIVLRNLLTNAFKYGGQTVSIEARQSGGRLDIAVIDDGWGIDEDVIKQLGQPFYRPDGARSRKTGGHGLGLYLSRTIVESHGGRLIIKSRKGQGTRVIIELPGDSSAEEAAGKDRDSEDGQQR